MQQYKTTEEAVGEEVTICHIQGEVREKNQRSYTVSAVVGGISQHITVDPEYVHQQLGLEVA